MKKNKIFLCLTIFLIILLFGLRNTRDIRLKNKIFKFVTNNYTDLNEFVINFNKKSSSDSSFKNIEAFKSHSNRIFIIFYFKSYGLTNSRLIYGFYFSKDGSIFSDLETKPVKKDNYWISKTDDSDYSMYMEHIKGKWYYFKSTD